MTFLDPPRPDTRHTIEQANLFGVEVSLCRLCDSCSDLRLIPPDAMVTSRGWFVQVKMITGDHKTIAIETARVLNMGTLIQGPQGLPVRSCYVDECRTLYIPNALQIGVHFV
jgi:H+-transporting ATPase